MKLHRGGREDMPKISVIIPTYNRAHLIGRSIKSVLNQTYQDFELIIVDDGSTDNTEEIVKNINDERIIYILHKENKGPSAARNTGIKASKGEFIAFQDSDDEWFPEKLTTHMDVFDNSPPEVGVVYSGFFRIESNKKIYIPKDGVTKKEGRIHSELLKHNFIGTPAVLIKKQCFEKTKLFDESLPALEDWELWIELSHYYDFKYINKPLLNSYYTPNGVNMQQNRYKALEIILTNHLEDFNANKKILSNYYLSIGNHLCSNGAFKNGRNYLIKSVKANYLNARALSLILISVLGQDAFSKIMHVYHTIRR